MTEQQEAFAELVERLRGLGAVRVRDGGFEVAFAGPPPVEDRDEPQVDDMDERKREHHAVLLRMAEEMP